MESHARELAGDVDHGLAVTFAVGVGVTALAADLSHAEELAPFVPFQSEGATSWPVFGAGTVLVPTTAGSDNSGLLSAGAAGDCGVTARGVVDDCETFAGAMVVKVGEIVDFCGVGGRMSFGAVCCE